MKLQDYKQTKIFICYCHKDAKWFSRLKVHLKPLVREREIDVWDDTMIAPGSIWQKDIKRSIKTAKVAILLISADFLASDFIATTELPALLQAAATEGVNIIPVIISPSGFQQHRVLSQFQAINNPQKPLINLKRGEQEFVWANVITSIKNSLSILQENVGTLTSKLAIARRINHDPLKNDCPPNAVSTDNLISDESHHQNHIRDGIKPSYKPKRASQPTKRYRSTVITILVSVSLTILAMSILMVRIDPEDQVQIDKANVYLDLTSSWKELSEVEKNGAIPLSKATLYVNFLVRKYGENAALNHRLGTTSALSKPFDWRSDPQHRIEAKQDTRKCSPEVTLSYMLNFDIKDEPINTPFKLDYEIDFWNAHNGPVGDWQAFYISQPTKLLIFKISFPKAKPYSSIRFLHAGGLKCNSAFYDFNKPEIQEGVDEKTGAKTIIWTIRSPETHWIYRMQWDW
jgi:hypothetical protein